MSAQRDKVSPITSVIDPDLGAVRRFITEMIAQGAIAALVTALLGLLTRMRDLNTELVRKIASHSRKRPPSETMRRLQLELPLLFSPPANDPPSSPPQPGNEHKLKTKTKRGAKIPHPH